MECTLCKIQYIVKAETPFNMQLNNHTKDSNGSSPKAILLTIHFKQPGHSFNKYANFILMGQISNTINTEIDTMKIKLKRREDFWILKLDTLTLKGLNQELNIV